MVPGLIKKAITEQRRDFRGVSWISLLESFSINDSDGSENVTQKGTRTASLEQNVLTLIPFCSICQMLANFSGVDYEF